MLRVSLLVDAAPQIRCVIHFDGILLLGHGEEPIELARKTVGLLWRTGFVGFKITVVIHT